MEARTDQAARDQVLELIKASRVCMMTTRGADGRFHGRPMATHHTEFTGDLWFFTSASSRKVLELDAYPDVGLAYIDTGKQNYVSITGTGEIVEDEAMVKKLWAEPLRTWFPKGPDDPDIRLLRVQVESAEYWDAPNNAMVMLFGYLKARTTGQRPDPGKHDQVEFPN